jgi:prephenate dehydratase
MAASTTEGVKHVCNDKRGFVIAGLDALQAHGVPVLAEDIGNTRHGKSNFTDFFLLAGAPVMQFLPDIQYSTMIAVTPHIDRVGLLEEILFQIAYHDLNLAKIHSRPAIDDVKYAVGEPQMFYLEIMCHSGQENFQRCVESLQYKFSLHGSQCDAVRVLGSYPVLRQTAVEESCSSALRAYPNNPI